MSSIFDVVYIYKADIYCEECGKNLIAGIKANNYGIVRGTGVSGCMTETEKQDSDNYPQASMIGEADSPQHCAACHEFLENPLTTDGYNYVRDMLARDPKSETVQMWAEYYGIDNERN